MQIISQAVEAKPYGEYLKAEASREAAKKIAAVSPRTGSQYQ
jgi:hypothetical protein